MTNKNTTITVTYSDSKLRTLVEEYITQQKSEFTLKGVCSYILYWAIEDGNVSNTKTLIESNKLSSNDQDRVKRILDAISVDGRIEANSSEHYRKN